MLIPLSTKTIYNTETNTFIRLRSPNQEGGVSILFYNGEDIHAVSSERIKGVLESWEILFDVATNQVMKLKEEAEE